MKVAVCLPSFNEAKNIRNITQIVDQGLSDFIAGNPGISAEIVNVDSDSIDDTAKIFLDTKTFNPKYSILLKEPSGKGKNILEFCSYALSNQIDFCLTIDTDVVSASPEWITKLLTPLVKGSAGYVTPIYERSRFEGSSTNHFVFPIIYALFGYIIRQPIAGDFAFTKKIAQDIFENNLRSNELIQSYGIDTYMTICAIGAGAEIAQVNLGRKLHSPSFGKLEYMFPQIAATMLLSGNKIHFSEKTLEMHEIKNNILPDLNFTHKKITEEMRDQALGILESNIDKDWVSDEQILKFVMAAKNFNHEEALMVATWTDVLASWIRHFLNPILTPEEARLAGNELLPFFVIRATNFWFWAETVKAIDVERAIENQAKMLRDKIQTK